MSETNTPATAEAIPPATALAPRERITTAFDPNDPIALYMDTGVYEQLQRVARLMASSGLVPEHLRSSKAVGDRPAQDRTADCFLVVAQAFRWRMDPFAVSQHTFVLKGKLGYEGKLIAAVINASGKTEQNLKYVYTGDKGTPNRTVTVVARLRGEKEDRTVEGTLGQWATDNDQWKPAKGQQDQMLSYRGAREWARRHMPEVLLGVSADEEIQQVIELGRTGAESYAPVRVSNGGALDRVAAGLEAGGAAPANAATCDHPGVPKNIPPGQEATCEACGEVLQGEPVERVVGEDDDTPAAIVEDIKNLAAKAAPTDKPRPRQSRLQEG